MKLKTLVRAHLGDVVDRCREDVPCEVALCVGLATVKAILDAMPCFVEKAVPSIRRVSFGQQLFPERTGRIERVLEQPAADATKDFKLAYCGRGRTWSDDSPILASGTPLNVQTNEFQRLDERAKSSFEI
ncbi:MAG TPA: hypothetical protein VF329_13560 [Gammaproteobacteria bacterium]